jgi:signal transduction histidine kinase
MHVIQPMCNSRYADAPAHAHHAPGRFRRHPAIAEHAPCDWQRRGPLGSFFVSASFHRHSDSNVTPSSRARSPWVRWSLARQLPLLTAAIVVIVMALSLTLTYGALRQGRSDALHARIQGLLRVLSQSTDATTKARVSALKTYASDSALIHAVEQPNLQRSPRQDSAIAAALGKVLIPTDSGLPVELWTTDGRRLAHIGTNVRGDSVAGLPPELRSLHGTRVSEIPTGAAGADSVEFGTLYQSSGRVYFWVIAPVMKDNRRIGYIAQQRRLVLNPAITRTVNDLSGEQLVVKLRNTKDGFVATLDGKPAPIAIKRDTTDSGFVLTHAGGERFIGAETPVKGTQLLIGIEAPESSIVAQPRATIRKLALFSLVLLIGGVSASWALSRRIVRPLVDLTTAAEAIAHGDYGRRVESHGKASDEVERLGASFNRMASEVEASQQLLASQVEEAQATSEELEQTNLQLQQASEAADEARDVALDANRAKSDFLAVMSHELRTPLNAIGGYAEILQLGIHGPVNEAQNDALLRISRSQQTLLSLINDVLNFAKLEAGEVHYSISDVAIGPVLSAIEDFVAPQLRGRKLSYAVHACEPGIAVRADADKLQQILINLLSNAIKYTPHGGKIDVACETAGDKVHVRIHDTGIGIAEDRVTKIFDPFIQVGRALNRPHEGVGLGLSISRDLASGMGGTLSVESVLGQGSTFTLTLDRAAAAT